MLNIVIQLLHSLKRCRRVLYDDDDKIKFFPTQIFIMQMDIMQFHNFKSCLIHFASFFLLYADVGEKISADYLNEHFPLPPRIAMNELLILVSAQRCIEFRG